MDVGPWMLPSGQNPFVGERSHVGHYRKRDWLQISLSFLEICRPKSISVAIRSSSSPRRAVFRQCGRAAVVSEASNRLPSIPGFPCLLLLRMLIEMKITVPPRRTPAPGFLLQLAGRPLAAGATVLLVSLVLFGGPVSADEFPPPRNTQAAGEHPPTPTEMLSLLQLPEGFEATLYAGEPDVRQPISFDFDDRGRLWVAENYTYSAHAKIAPDQRDRILILHDTDGDGQHDERTVFWEGGRMLTSVVWGFDGAWMLNDGTLCFLPDRNHDDVPDSEPVPLLDGWTQGAGHNFVNGLTWGPDGWLYGRHGITDTSYPGTVDTPREDRQPMNCGIWRFHPVRKEFEVVCHGTTNPWGLDYNASGDFFMTNNVIGHLWHVIPGAHYERMFGADFNPRLYQLMKQTADHYHWDDTGSWTKSRNGAADDLGGGHSHCGGLIYQGQNFPEPWRGLMLMCNTHGRRVNANRLEPSGSGYVGRRSPDFLSVDNDWFRGVELRTGPRGEVYLSDWSDYGECHDHDGVHRTSGRIYRIAYRGLPSYADSPDVDERGTPLVHGTPLPQASLSELTGQVGLPVWHQRRVRRRLQEASLAASAEREATEIDRAVIRLEAALHRPMVARTAAWSLHAMQRISAETAAELLQSTDPVLRKLAVTVICEQLPLRQALAVPLQQAVANESDLTVLLAVASGLQQIPSAIADPTQQTLVHALIKELTTGTPAKHVAADENLELMTWYALVHHGLSGFEPGGPSAQLDAFATRYRVETAAADQLGRVIVNSPAFAVLPTDDRGLTDAETRQVQRQLEAVLTALRGRGAVPQPPQWARLTHAMKKSGDDRIGQLMSELGVVFGDGASVQRLQGLVANREEDHVVRRQAIRALAQSADASSVPILLKVLNDKAVYVDVATSLAAFDDPRIPVELLKRWNSLRHGARQAAADTLCSRRSYAAPLVAAIENGQLAATELSAAQVRQLLSFGDEHIRAVMEREWGILNRTSADRQALIVQWKEKLTPQVLQEADATRGAAVFRKSCGNCHRLYGEGGKIGPDLTGGNRSNLDYLLGNIIAPSDEVPRQYTTSILALESGRVITGVVVSESATTLSVQTDKERLEIPVNDVEERTRTNLSLMPDGLLDPLSETDVRDLIFYLQQKR